ncbi:zinc finger protein 182-like, partial [Artemia franciscana]|uniref:zinc finger protein 182-like n=1 Tax=Artemia franciscana TaxID=6661 RepID=UPI0032DBC2B5
MRTHTGEKLFKGDVCKHSSNQKSHLAKHMRTHTGEKPFKWDVCKHSFNQKGHLAKHMRTHTGEKLFKCDVCKRSFNQKSKLAIHLRTHTDENPFNCDMKTKFLSEECSCHVHEKSHSTVAYDYQALSVSTVTMNTDIVSWIPTSTPKVDLSLGKTDAPFQPKLARYPLTNGQRFSKKPYSTEWVKYSILK